jgi:choline dehydrogenase
LEAKDSDFVIVGGGSAGCVLAARLSEIAEARVLLLEAGPSDRNPNIHVPAATYRMFGGPLTWGYHTAPLRQVGDRRLIFPQSRVLGGGSSINAMVYTRGNPADYDAWAAEEGCAGWSWQEVLPYFRRAEDNERFANAFHGSNGPLAVSDQISPHPLTKVFLRAAQQAGLPFNPDFNGARQEGCGLYQVTQRAGRRCSTAIGYLAVARRRPNLTVVTRATALRVVIERGRAVAVDYVEGRNRRVKRVRATAEVVLAAGTVGSPKLLLLSGIGPANELRALGIDIVHPLPGVGRNLQDHIDVPVISALSGPFSYDGHKRLHKMLWAGLEYVLFRSGPATTNHAEGGGFWWSDRRDGAPDIQFHFLANAGLKAPVPGIAGYGCTLNSAYLRPRSRGTVRLASADPHDAPIIDPNYWAEPADLAASIAGCKLAREIMAQPAFRPFVAREQLPGPDCFSDAALAAYARVAGKTDFHPVGTCKMGSDENAVVDPELRLRGIGALRVVDASVMPRLISANTNAASIMIGEKGSDFIKKEHQDARSGFLSTSDAPRGRCPMLARRHC